MSTLAVEVVYRGIFQKTLARNIVRSIVFAAARTAKSAPPSGVTATLRSVTASRPSSSPS